MPNGIDGSPLASLLNGSSYHQNSDQYVRQFWRDGTNWQVADLTQWTGAPLKQNADPGSP
jgi:hypothetical protein